MAKMGASIGIYFKINRMPKWIIDEKKLERELHTALKQAGQAIKSDFELTTRSFRERPAFKVWGPTLQGSIMMVSVSTDSGKYRYLDEGTKPHVIRPRRAKMLYFQWGGKGSYRSKTKAGVMTSFSGGPSGPMVLRKMVHHPGIEARYFAFGIARKRAPEIQQNIAAAMYRAAQQSLAESGPLGPVGMP